MAVVELKVPDIGDFKEVEVIELLVKPGDTVALDQSLVTVESDKASMEIPATQAGVLRELKVNLGDRVGEGSVLGLVEVAGTDAAAEPSPQPASASGNGGESGGAAEASSAASGGGRTGESGAAEASPPAGGGDESGPAPAPSPAEGEQAGGEGGAPASAAAVEVVVPDIGDFAEVAVIEIFVKPGDTVKAEQSLVTVESDKASMEIPSSHAGVVEQVLVTLGDTISKGAPLVRLKAESGAGGAPSPQPSPQPTPAAAAPRAPAAAAPRAPAAASSAAPSPATRDTAGGEGAAVPAHDPTAPVSAALPHASPSIRRLARELGVPLAEVKGSGPKGRITQEDLQGFVKQVMAGDTRTAAQQAKAPAPAPAAAPAPAGAFPGLLPWPQVDFAKFGAVERKPLSRIKKLSGANLHRNWVTIPHVTNHDEADITELEAFRLQLNKENEKAGVKVTMLAFLVKACAAALKQFPEFNASLDGDELVLKRYVHVGFAADTPNGLVVPVIRDADQKGILQISREMSELAKKARDGKLTPGEMTGGCFSISSLGGIGGTYFTPIINAPEVAILGVCRSAMQPRWDGQAFVPRLILPLSLSWDHRVIDGAAAARFNAYLGAILADFRRVML